MTDNITVTAGSGTTIATDNVGGVNYQRIKLALGVEGTIDGNVSSTLPMPTSPPGSVHLTNSPTVTAGAYATGAVVGGLISFSGAARINSGSGLIQSALVTVKTALTAPFDVFFFDTNPTNSTFTDNVALAVNVADLPFLCGIAHCTDLVPAGTPQVLQALNLAIPFKLSAAATTLYAVIVMRGSGETLASTSAIQLSVIIVQD